MTERRRRPAASGDAAAGAASALVRRRGAVLLVRRGNDPAMGLWAPPGGRMKPGETAGEAAVRELAEETGLVGTPGREWPAILIDDHRIVAVEVEVAGQQVPRAADDALAVAWVPLGSIDEESLAPGVAELLRATTPPRSRSERPTNNPSHRM